MGEYWEAILLGIVQGVAEFLPISSSGHLTIAQAVFAESSAAPSTATPLQMNIALHLGTLLSILVCYRRDLLVLLKQPRTWPPILIATLPIVVVGFTMKDFVEQSFQTPLLAGCCLLITAGLLVFGQKRDRHTQQQTDEEQTASVVRHLETLSWRDSLFIGVFQAVAILPGISRSGSTIAAGLIVGLRREEAARFSFLIAIPAISGAAILLIKDFFETESTTANLGVLGLGAMVAFVVGVLSLSWLIRLVSQRKLHWFSWYCAIVGSATIIWQLAVS